LAARTDIITTAITRLFANSSPTAAMGTLSSTGRRWWQRLLNPVDDISKQTDRAMYYGLAICSLS
jgi:hypothetical protein